MGKQTSRESFLFGSKLKLGNSGDFKKAWAGAYGDIGFAVGLKTPWTVVIEPGKTPEWQIPTLTIDNFHGGFGLFYANLKGEQVKVPIWPPAKKE